MRSFERTGPNDYALLLLRLAGFYLAFGHGWAKFSALVTGDGAGLVGMVEGLGFPLPTLFAWALGITEFLGGLCIALGLGTRLAGALVAFAMFVAAFVRHRAITQFLAWVGLSGATDEQLRSWGDPERAVLFMLIGSGLLILGPGRLSLDRVLAERR